MTAHSFLSAYAPHFGEDRNKDGRVSRFSVNQTKKIKRAAEEKESEIMRQARMCRPKVTTVQQKHWWAS